MNKTGIAIFIGIVIIVAGAALLFLGKSDSAQIPSPPSSTTGMFAPENQVDQNQKITPPTSIPKELNSSSQSIKEFTVTGSNYSFSPSTLTAKKGDKVRITFKNTDGMHDFQIDALHVATRVIKTGEKETVEFTANTVGTFEYYCSVSSHRAMGMKGTLVVQ